MKKVAFIFSRDITDVPALIETLKRLSAYSNHLEEVSGQKLVVSFFQKTASLDFESLGFDLEIHWMKFQYFKFLRTLVYISRYFRGWKLIAANLWTDFPILLTTKLLTRNKVWIQISIHGDLYGSKTILPVKLYKFFVSKCLRFADSCRFVSKELKGAYGDLLGIREDRTLISPIPISNIYLNNQILPFSENGLGYVGRIHTERGYDEWSRIAKRFHFHNNSATFKIIGGGADFGIFQELMLGSIAEKTTFYGRLDSETLSKSWSSFHILLSCAETEGYGLAIREAILQGKIVIARRNLGTMSLESMYPQCIHLYTSVEEAVGLLNELWESSISNKCSNLMKKDLIKQNKASLSALIESWTK